MITQEFIAFLMYAFALIGLAIGILIIVLLVKRLFR